MTERIKADILALFEEYKRIEGAKGNHLSDTGICKAALGSRDFIGNFYKWDGGNGGPTLHTLMRFETYLRDRVGAEFHKAFMERRASMVLPDGGF